MTSTVHRREPPPRKALSVRARHAALTASKYQQPVPPSILDQFAPDVDCRPFLAQVRQTLDGNLLHYSDRVMLLWSAQRQGIGRFEANLLIATVQHRSAREQSQPAHVVARVSNPCLGIGDRRWKPVLQIAAGITAIIALEFCLLRFAIHALLGV